MNENENSPDVLSLENEENKLETTPDLPNETEPLAENLDKNLVESQELPLPENESDPQSSVPATEATPDEKASSEKLPDESKDKTSKKVRNTFGSFLLHPIRTANNVHEVPASVSLVFMIFNGLAAAFFSTLVYKAFLGNLPDMMIGIIVPFSAIILSSLVLFVALYIFSKTSLHTLSLKGAWGTVGLSSIPLTISLILLTVGAFFFSKYPLIVLAILTFVVFFSNVFSILIVDRGVHSKLTADGRRFFVVALGISLKNSAIILSYMLIFNRYYGGVVAYVTSLLDKA